MSDSASTRRTLSKRERDRKIKAIYREMEAKKNELGLQAPQIKRGPVFYLVVLMGLALIGGLVVQATGKGGGKNMQDGKIVTAQKSVNALAEALGRYKFHCGVYPTAEEGLEALVLKRPIWYTSSSVRGVGSLLELPTKPVTPRMFRITCQVSSL